VAGYIENHSMQGRDRHFVIRSALCTLLLFDDADGGSCLHDHRYYENSLRTMLTRSTRGALAVNCAVAPSQFKPDSVISPRYEAPLRSKAKSREIKTLKQKLSRSERKYIDSNRVTFEATPQQAAIFNEAIEHAHTKADELGSSNTPARRIWDSLYASRERQERNGTRVGVRHCPELLRPAFPTLSQTHTTHSPAPPPSSYSDPSLSLCSLLYY